MTERVSMNQMKWSNMVVFFSTFLLALGCILLSSVHSVHNHTHKIPCYSVMLMSVGLLGMVAAFTRKLCILPILMLSLVLLTVATLRIVYVRLVDKKVQCLDAATQLHIEQGTTYLEAMPGVYFEIGSKVQLFAVVDPDTLRECETHISEMWVHSVFLLLTLLLCCLICAWKFARAIQKDRDVVLYTEIDSDGTVHYAEGDFHADDTLLIPDLSKSLEEN